MSAAQRIAVSVARAWVRLYTSRMPGELRATRRAEIDADLWHHAKDGEERVAYPLVTALEILQRTCFGVLDDLSWRFEARGRERGASSVTRRYTMAWSARRSRWMSITSVAGGAVVLFMFVVTPTLTSYFASVGIPLPLPTRIVIGVSTFLTAYWWAFLAGGVALLLGLVRIEKRVTYAVLSRVGAFHDDDVDTAMDARLSKLEPIAIVGLGILVGAMILAMFLPIFDAVSAMR